MTLVVSALTQDCVWQAADRRLTDLRTGRPCSTDTNKAIHFAGGMLFAYTGPARLEGTDTAVWIADQLWRGNDADEGLRLLRGSLERAIGLQRSELRSFAVDGVGWAMDRLTGAIGPRLLRISNCLDDQGVWAGALQDGIRMWDGMLKPDAGPSMRSAGQPVPLEIGRRWERQVRRRLAAKAPSADIGICLVQLIREVADRNPMVGQGVLLSAIPRSAVESSVGATLASMPLATEATFKYFPEGSDQGIDKGPEVAHPGGTRMSKFSAQTDAAGNQSVEAMFRIPERRAS